MEFSVMMEMPFKSVLFQYGSHQLCVAIEHLKGG
jgi:hypothetical protein